MKAKFINFLLTLSKFSAVIRNYILLTIVLVGSYFIITEVEKVIKDQDQLKYMLMLVFVCVAVPILVSQILKARVFIIALIMMCISKISNIYFIDYLVIENLFNITDLSYYHSLFNYLMKTIIFFSLFGVLIDIVFVDKLAINFLTLKGLKRILTF